jgi:hypothetical protein
MRELGRGGNGGGVAVAVLVVLSLMVAVGALMASLTAEESWRHREEREGQAASSQWCTQREKERGAGHSSVCASLLRVSPLRCASNRPSSVPLSLLLSLSPPLNQATSDLPQLRGATAHSTSRTRVDWNSTQRTLLPSTLCVHRCQSRVERTSKSVRDPPKPFNRGEELELTSTGMKGPSDREDQG